MAVHVHTPIFVVLYWARSGSSFLPPRAFLLHPVRWKVLAARYAHARQSLTPQAIVVHGLGRICAVQSVVGGRLLQLRDDLRRTFISIVNVTNDVW